MDRHARSPRRFVFSRKSRRRLVGRHAAVACERCATIDGITFLGKRPTAKILERPSKPRRTVRGAWKTGKQGSSYMITILVVRSPTGGNE
jgi:hypothetical protein